MRLLIQNLLIATLLLVPALLTAENSTQASGYTIHHNAFLSSELSPDMTKAYGIRRSSNRAMLNISIIKDEVGTTGTPVTAEVTATAKNLRGQVRYIPLREIKEAAAIYYIGDFLVENQEMVDFDIKVKPAGETATYSASLKQQFFTR